MATFEQRDSGWWSAKIRRKGYPSQSQTFLTKRDAEMWARDVENKMDRGVFVDRAEAESTTLSEAIDRYLKEVTPRHKGAEAETYRLRAIQRHKIACRSLAAISAGKDIKEYADERGESVSPASVVKDLNLISAIFTVARRDWKINAENPVRNIKKPKVDNARERRLSADEERYLLSALDDSGKGENSNRVVGQVVRFALETAMRQSEIVGIQRKHVFPSHVFLPTTKNGKSREVPLSIAARELVKGVQIGKVFNTTASALKQSFQRGVKRARRQYEKDCADNGNRPNEDFLVNLTFHDLRHEATSRLAEKLSMQELMKVVGHSDPRMVMRYYHPRAEDLAKKLG